MKTPFLAAIATVLLLSAPSTFADSLNSHSQGGLRLEQPRPGDRDFNYGYAQNHRVTPQERAHWEAEQRRNDHRDDRRADDHFDRNQNFGFDRNHRVTPGERRHWEEIHNYGYAQNHRVTPQERAHWEDQYRH